MIGRSRTFFGRLFTTQLVIIIIALSLLGGMFGYLLQKYYSGAKQWELVERAERTISLFEQGFIDGSTDEIRERVYAISESSGNNLWLIDDSGQILASSERAEGVSRVAINDNEIQYVLSGNSISKGITGPQHQHLLVALPVWYYDGRIMIFPEGNMHEEYEVVGAFALSASLGDIGITISRIMRLILQSGLIAVVAAGFLSFSFSKSISRPLEKLKYGALDIAKGRFRKIENKKDSLEVEHLITAFNYASEKVEESIEEHKAIEKMRRQFLANVSHEFRVPLTSIKGFLELMEDGDISREDALSYIGTMMKDTQYLERLVEDLLDLCRMEAGEAQLKLENILVEDLIESCIQSLAPVAEANGVVLKTNICQGEYVFRGDKDRVFQVLSNLINNAIAASNEHSVIEVRAYRKDKAIVFEVQDGGVGIPADLQGQIWERFYKVNSARTRGQKGSGLGLAIVKQIVEKHGGSVGVVSETGQGSTFWFSIPLLGINDEHR